MGSRLLTDPVMSLLKDLVGQGGFEPPTPSLSGTYSNQLSYKPPVAVSSADIGARTARARPWRKRNVDGGVPHMDLIDPETDGPDVSKRSDRDA